MTGYKSKTLATWLAFLGGGLGLHRFYLYGFKDVGGWLWAAATLIGLQGLRLHVTQGQDNHGAWLLLPVLGFSLSAGALMALVYGLMPDEKWNARFNPQGPEHQAGWLTVFGIVLSLLIGAGILMSTIAFSAQRYFEYGAEGQAEVQGNSERLSQ
jgi:hypothetical protein